jgi:hypothetical protein
MTLAATPQFSVGRRRAVRIALLAVAAPPLFTLLGVLLYMAHDPVPDAWVWIGMWTILIAAAASGDETVITEESRRPKGAGLRVAHGVAALAVTLVFLLFHVANHLFGLIGPEAHLAVMTLGRTVYRAKVVEPVLVMLLLFLAGSGALLLWRCTSAAMDRRRAFQIASGAYLAFFILGHMNSVFVFARAWLGIETGWGFATGAPTGLVADAWNVRLIPHYAFAVFFALAHLASGARMVMLAHGGGASLANRAAFSGALAAAIVALAIVLGMCGLRLGTP